MSIEILFRYKENKKSLFFEPDTITKDALVKYLTISKIGGTEPSKKYYSFCFGGGNLINSDYAINNSLKTNNLKIGEKNRVVITKVDDKTKAILNKLI